MRLTALTVLLAAATALSAQDADLPAKPQTPAAPISLSVLVHDRSGNIVPNLTAKDFTLSVGGRTGEKKPQPILSLTPDASPLTLGILVDVGRSQRDPLPDERTALGALLTATLTPATLASSTPANNTPANRAFLMHFAKPIELLQDATADRKKLDAALRNLGTESPTFNLKPDPDDGTLDSEGRRIRSGGTSLYDTLFLAADEITSKLTGRKLLLLLTDGIDVNSKESLTDALEAAQRSDTVIYAIYFKRDQRSDRKESDRSSTNGPGSGGGSPSGYPGGGSGGGYPGRYPGSGYPGNRNPNDPNSTGGTRPGGPGSSRKPLVDGKQVLERLCGETGGAVYEVTKKQTLDDIVPLIAADIRAAYRLTFTPDTAAARSGYHQIDLRLTGELSKKKLDIQARDGYYAPESR